MSSLLAIIDAELEDAEGASTSSFAATSRASVFATIEQVRRLGDAATLEQDPPSVFLWPSLIAATHGCDDAPMHDAHDLTYVKREYAQYIASAPADECGALAFDEFQARRWHQLQAASAAPTTPVARISSVAVKTPAALSRTHELVQRSVDQLAASARNWEAERAAQQAEIDALERGAVRGSLFASPPPSRLPSLAPLVALPTAAPLVAPPTGAASFGAMFRGASSAPPPPPSLPTQPLSSTSSLSSVVVPLPQACAPASSAPLARSSSSAPPRVEVIEISDSDDDVAATPPPVPPLSAGAQSSSSSSSSSSTSASSIAKPALAASTPGTSSSPSSIDSLLAGLELVPLATHAQRGNDLVAARVLAHEAAAAAAAESAAAAATAAAAALSADVLKKRPLTAAEDAIIAKAFAVPGNQLVIEAFSIPLMGRHVQCLRPGQWLNDEVMNFYFEMLRERAERHEAAAAAAIAAGSVAPPVPRCHFFSTFFYLKLAKTSDGPYVYKNVQRWTRRLKANIFTCDLVLLPIHVSDSHWCLAAIDMRAKMIRYWDSLGGGGDGGCLQKLLRYLGDEALDKAPKMPFNASEWRVEVAPNAPRQLNGFDCGVFTCKLADYLSEGRAPAYDQADMPYFRRRMLLETMNQRIE